MAMKFENKKALDKAVIDMVKNYGNEEGNTISLDMTELYSIAESIETSAREEGRKEQRELDMKLYGTAFEKVGEVDTDRNWELKSLTKGKQ